MMIIAWTERATALQEEQRHITELRSTSMLLNFIVED